MAKELDCADVMPGCEHKMRGETEADVMAKAAKHAKESHGIDEMDPKTAEMVRSKIRDV
jgi:predicted small metal-binding protein